MFNYVTHEWKSPFMFHNRFKRIIIIIIKTSSLFCIRSLKKKKNCTQEMCYQYLHYTLKELVQSQLNFLVVVYKV